jgi:hypothetical protein
MFGSSTDFTPPPRANLHPKIEKQRTTSMIFHTYVRVRCYNVKYKSIKVFKTPSFGIGKCNSFIHNTKIIPLQSKSATIPRTWSGLLFTMIQVYLV